MSDWKPSSAEEVYLPKGAEPISQQSSQPQGSIASQGIGYVQQHPFKAFFQPAAQTLTGNTIQNALVDNSGTPIPQSLTAPFDSGVQMASNPAFRTNDIAQRFVGGMVGNLADQVTTPSNLALTALVSKGAAVMANNPVTRRFLQTQLPTMSADLLKANPMEPIYKEINGIQADITKPLPPNAPRLVQIGRNFKDAIDSAVDGLGAKYKPLIGNSPIDPIDIQKVLPFDIKGGEAGTATAYEPTGITKKLGINPSDIKTTADLWQARTDLGTILSENSWGKSDVFKNNNIREQDVMDLMQKMKALVMNNMDESTRKSLNILDNHYQNAIGAAKSLTRSIYNPNTDEIKTGPLMNLFRKDSGAFEGKQDLLNKLNYFNSNVGKFSQQVLNHINTMARNKMIKNVIGGGALVAGAGALANKFIVQPAINRFQEVTSDMGGDSNGQ